jgi:hypothetical protein
LRTPVGRDKAGPVLRMVILYAIGGVDAVVLCGGYF